jgi:eukaryotic-like serine/threonine-protein kinase
MIVQDGTDASAPAASRSRESGRSSGATYQELLPIGRGGSANISIALARGIGGFSKLVVLKSIRDELIAQSDAVKMFMDEARVSARMNHPNVVHVYEVFLRRGVPVIAMEYLDGQALSTIMARGHGSGALSLELAVAIQAKVLAALHYAHTLRDYTGEPAGLIHRDVSPQNVMITYDGQVKLVDFGVAKLTKTGHQTRTGVVKGKLAYMAPEQFIGDVDCRADVFAVGVMLWELASGQRFWGDLPEPALVGRLIARDLPHLRVQPDMDDRIAQICKRALAPDVNDRYPTALAMQEDLERYLVQRGVVVTPGAIAQLVADTCPAARDQVQGAIREQLSGLGLSLTGDIEVPVGERLRPKRSTEPRAIWRRVAIAAAIAGLGALAGRGIAFSPTPAAPPPVLERALEATDGTADAVNASAPAARPEVNLPSLVRLTASAQPADTHWFLDERKLDSNPFSLSLPKDEALHTLRAEAEGHQSFSKAIRFVTDADITVVLLRTAAEAGAEAPPAAPKNRRAGSARARAAAAQVTESRTETLDVEPRAPLPEPAEPTPVTPAQAEEERPVDFGDRLERGVTPERRRFGIDVSYPTDRARQ